MNDTIRDRIRWAWLSLLTILVGVLAWNGLIGPDSTAFEEISVERLNVVEPDGMPRVVITSRAHLPGLYMDGREYPHPTRDFGGLVFYNSEGDEIGGLVFDAEVIEGRHVANAHLAFDQFKQDQTVTLSYQDDDGRRTAGLRVDDQPDEPLLPLIELNARIADAETEQEASALREELRTHAKERRMHTERLFAGKIPDGTSVVRLSDKLGRARIIMAVDSAGEPKVRLLDGNGEVIAQLP